MRGVSSLQMAGKDRLHDRRPGFGARPKYWWHINRSGGTLDVGVAEKPIKALLWYAYTTMGIKTRDFRWFSTDYAHCPIKCLQELLHSACVFPSSGPQTYWFRQWRWCKKLLCEHTHSKGGDWSILCGVEICRAQGAHSIYLHYRSCRCSGYIPF